MSEVKRRKTAPEQPATVPCQAEFMEIKTEPLMNSSPEIQLPSTSSTSIGSPSDRLRLCTDVDPKLEDTVTSGSSTTEVEDVAEDCQGPLCGVQISGWGQSPLQPADVAHDAAGPVPDDGFVPAAPAGEVTPHEDKTLGPRMLAEFTWDDLPQPPIDPELRRERFDSPTGPVQPFVDEYTAFVSIWDRDVMEKIAFETNRYATQKLLKQMDEGTLEGSSRLLSWVDTDADELYVFFAIILAMGVVVKSDVSEYWSVNSDIFDTPNFGSHMSYNRFSTLSSNLHFIDNKADQSQLSKAELKIVKIAPIVEHLNEKFQKLFNLGQCVALDESLTQWKGCLSINQRIKSKAASMGVKTYEVCDSNTGYLWRFEIYAGREDNRQKSDFGYVTSLVLKLLRGLEYKGHTIFMDNYYNSPLLARILKSLGFDCVGTLRPSRRHVPAWLRRAELAAGGMRGAGSGDVDVLLWRDRRLVPLLSTYHGAAQVARRGQLVPQLVVDYNLHMGGVDKKDQLLAMYPLERKRTSVWYKKIFRRFLNASVLNAYILSKGGPRRPTHRQFRKRLITQILSKHGKSNKELTLTKTERKIKLSKEILQHVPTMYPHLKNQKNRSRGRCKVCHKRVSMHCPGCEVALCFGECFKRYHS